MFFQGSLPSIQELIPFIIAISLIIGDIFILKIGLAITKAEEKSSFKWVAGSFGIQFGLIFFISAPMILEGLIGGFSNGGPNPAIISLVIIFSLFVDINVINVIHKIGLKKSIIIGLLIMVPVTIAMWLIGQNLGDLFY
ncbi:MAG: hypothetical protein ACFE9Z_11390 [Promethearchaeota archaeon]